MKTLKSKLYLITGIVIGGVVFSVYSFTNANYEKNDQIEREKVVVEEKSRKEIEQPQKIEIKIGTINNVTNTTNYQNHYENNNNNYYFTTPTEEVVEESQFEEIEEDTSDSDFENDPIFTNDISPTSFDISLDSQNLIINGFEPFENIDSAIDKLKTEDMIIEKINDTYFLQRQDENVEDLSYLITLEINEDNQVVVFSYSKFKNEDPFNLILPNNVNIGSDAHDITNFYHDSYRMDTFGQEDEIVVSMDYTFAYNDDPTLIGNLTFDLKCNINEEIEQATLFGFRYSFTGF